MVPTGQPRTRAASSYAISCRSQRTMGGAEPLRQPRELGVNQLGHFSRFAVRQSRGGRVRLDRGRSFSQPAPAVGQPRAQTNTVRHPMQPARYRITPADRASFSRKDEESGLKDVLRVVAVAQHLATDPADHRSVAIDDCRECQLGHFAILSQETLEQLPVGQARHRPRCSNTPSDFNTAPT